jgi:hypothetical protein
MRSRSKPVLPSARCLDHSFVDPHWLRPYFWNASDSHSTSTHIYIHYRKQSLPVSQEVHREPKLQLSVKPLFAESTGSGSRRRTGLRWRAPSPSFLLSALGEGFSWRCHRRRRNGCLRLLNSPRARRTWLSAKKHTRRRVHFHREHYIFSECFDNAHGEFSKKTSHFRVQSFSLIHIHSYNVHVQN